MKIVLALMLCVFSSASFAVESLSDEKAVSALTEKVSAKLAKGEYRQAIELMRPYWPMPQAEIQNLSYQTESQLGMVSTRFGAVVGAELVADEKVGKSLIKHTLILKFENHAVRWFIVYYKPKSGWQIDAVVWDDKLHEVFK